MSALHHPHSRGLGWYLGEESWAHPGAMTLLVTGARHFKAIQQDPDDCDRITRKHECALVEHLGRRAYF